jgi:hypothetical protein
MPAQLHREIQSQKKEEEEEEEEKKKRYKEAYGS